MGSKMKDSISGGKKEEKKEGGAEGAAESGDKGATDAKKER